MSNYRNFISDFPDRCGSLFRDFERPARNRGREVTLMLCAAMPSIVIPLERLTGPGKDTAHPSRDWQRFERAKTDLDELVGQDFLGSRLWPASDSRAWSFDELADVSDGPDSWPELRDPKPLGTKKKAGTVLWHLRNALSHGNIYSRGNPEIEQLILLSKSRGAPRFSFIAVAPDDFKTFLSNWLTFITEVDLPAFMVSEVEGYPFNAAFTGPDSAQP